MNRCQSQKFETNIFFRLTSSVLLRLTVRQNLVFRGWNYSKLFNNHGKVAKTRKELLKHYFWLHSGPSLSVKKKWKKKQFIKILDFYFVVLNLCPDIVRSNSSKINIVSLIVFYSFCFVRCSSELVSRFQSHILGRGLLVILIDCMIFLSPLLDCMKFLLPLLDVERIPISTVSFLAQLDFRFFSNRMCSFDFKSKWL